MKYLLVMSVAQGVGSGVQNRSPFVGKIPDRKKKNPRNPKGCSRGFNVAQTLSQCNRQMDEICFPVYGKKC